MARRSRYLWSAHADCGSADGTGLTLTIPPDWPSGVYLGRLTTLPGKDKPYWQSYVVFVVWADRPADILLQVSDNNWQAYNRWPDNYSVYTAPRACKVPGLI